MSKLSAISCVSKYFDTSPFCASLSHISLKSVILTKENNILIRETILCSKLQTIYNKRRQTDVPLWEGTKAHNKSLYRIKVDKVCLLHIRSDVYKLRGERYPLFESVNDVENHV